MAPRGSELPISQSKSSRRGNNILADFRTIFKIFTWFEPHGRCKDGSTVVFDEIDIGRRILTWPTDLSGIASVLAPGQVRANFFSLELEKGRIAWPPFKPYLFADSLAEPPWFPSGGPHAEFGAVAGFPEESINRAIRPVSGEVYHGGGCNGRMGRLWRISRTT